MQRPLRVATAFSGGLAAPEFALKYSGIARKGDNGVLYKHETVDGFKTEKACLEHKNIEDRHLKRIKAQTNIKEWSMDCVKGG